MTDDNAPRGECSCGMPAGACVSHGAPLPDTDTVRCPRCGRIWRGELLSPGWVLKHPPPLVALMAEVEWRRRRHEKPLRRAFLPAKRPMTIPDTL